MRVRIRPTPIRFARHGRPGDISLPSRKTASSSLPARVLGLTPTRPASNQSIPPGAPQPAVVGYNGDVFLSPSEFVPKRASPARRLPARTNSATSPLLASAGVCVGLVTMLMSNGWSYQSFSLGMFLWALALLVIALTGIVRCCQKNAHAFNFYSLALGCFTVLYPASAVAHMLRHDEGRQGYYDLAQLPVHQQTRQVYFALLLVSIGLAAFWAGLAVKKVDARLPLKKLTISKPLLWIAGLTFTALGVAGLFVLMQGEPDLYAALTTVDRSRFTVGGGMARYAFMSHWYSWGISFIMLALMAGTDKTSLKRRIFGSAALILLPVTIYYTGGRAYTLVWVCTFLLVAQRLGVGVSRGVLTVALVGYAGLMLFVTEIRTVQSNPFYSGTVTQNVMNVFDWQYGRYSLTAAGVDIVDSRGFGFGGTVLSGIVYTINAPFHLLGSPLPVAPHDDISDIVTPYLVRDAQSSFIVPGIICDLYYNFGFVGVIAGLFLFATLIRMLGHFIDNAKYVGSVCFFVLTVTVVSILGLSGSCTNWLFTVVTDAVPAVCIFGIEVTSRFPIRAFRRTSTLRPTAGIVS